MSLTRSPPSETEGSDGRFLISYDRTLVIKEVSSEDIADMHSNLSNYHQVRPLQPSCPTVCARLAEPTASLLLAIGCLSLRSTAYLLFTHLGSTAAAGGPHCLLLFDLTETGCVSSHWARIV